jgi:hypothetical protein
MAFAQFQKNALQITKGSPTPYRSSEKVTRTFCAHCGSPLSYQTDGSDKVEIPIGVFDDPEPLASTMHIWVSQKLSWIPISDDFPQRQD